MEPVTMALIGGTLAAGGATANYFGGRNESKRQQAAIDEYRRRSAQLYNQMANDAWKQGLERQRATGDVIRGLVPTMGAQRAPAPQVADQLPAAPSGNGTDYDRFMAAAMEPSLRRAQTQVNATQSGMDRDALARALDDLDFSSGVEHMAQAPAHVRYQWLKQRQLEEARAQLESVLNTTSNKTRNLQLLGAGLSSLGQMGMMAAGHMGGPSAGIPGANGAATYGGGTMPGPAQASPGGSFYDMSLYR